MSIDFDTLPALAADRASQIWAVDDALKALATLDERRARVVELRFFCGLIR